MPEPDAVVQALLAKCRQDHHAWINGDSSGYALPPDGALMGALGDTGRGGPETTARQRMAAAMWRSGSGEVELVAGGVANDIAWLVMIERATVVFADRAAPSRWELRVTELFRRHGDAWERFHRHADPLTTFHPINEILGLFGSDPD